MPDDSKNRPAPGSAIKKSYEFARDWAKDQAQKRLFTKQGKKRGGLK